MHHYFNIVQNVHKDKPKNILRYSRKYSYRVMPVIFSAYKTVSQRSQLYTVTWRASYRTATVNAVCNNATGNVFKCTLYKPVNWLLSPLHISKFYQQICVISHIFRITYVYMITQFVSLKKSQCDFCEEWTKHLGTVYMQPAQPFIRTAVRTTSAIVGLHAGNMKFNTENKDRVRIL
jgi:hypothetical protein